MVSGLKGCDVNRDCGGCANVG